jgi:GT2 family glycosyltransferase
MKLERARLRTRILRNALTTIRQRDGSLHRVLGKTWSVVWREGLGGVRSRILVLATTASPPPQQTPEEGYADWISRFDSLRDHDVAEARQHLASLSLPEVLILLIARPDTIGSVERIVATWNRAIHPEWHGAIVLSAELTTVQRDTIESLAGLRGRIAVLHSNEKVAALRQRFAYTLICFGRVLLNSLSTYMFLEAATRTGAEIVYADNDRMDALGQRNNPAFKPQFSGAYIAHYNYIGDCLLLGRNVAFPMEGAGALSELTPAGYDGLVARLVRDRHVEHVPFILYHALDDVRRETHDTPHYPQSGPSVAIIIPTRDGVAYLRACIDSILGKTSYDLARVEILVIDNNSTEEETHAYFEEIAQIGNIRVLDYPQPFNFAAINNFGASHTDKDILLFLNNDMMVLDPHWLSKLVFYAAKEDVGIVGAKLLFPDGTIQHGGCAAGANHGTVKHLLMHARPDEIAATDHTREMTTVTGACAAVRRCVFEKIGGFDPVLRITWNDVRFCLDCIAAGYRNIYVADPLLYHDESKTRGRDNTKAKMQRYFVEADYARRPFAAYFFDDPSYNPNLSVELDEIFAQPPRVRRPWARAAGRPPCILILSITYQFGFGVPVVIQQQVRRLRQLGYEVIIGGPQGENEIAFPGCTRIIFNSAREAAVYAFEHDVALIVSHTHPFFEIPCVIGAHIPVLSYDYGEPPAELFPDPTRSYLLDVARQKRAAAPLTTLIATISQAVKDETLNNSAIVLGLANSHLPAWTDSFLKRREDIRKQLGWDTHFVVLTVCRFSENERAYKGLDKIAEIATEFPYQHGQRAREPVWALAGRGDANDVQQVRELGFTVFPNVPDEKMVDLYLAADAYLGFSRWEGYNLGISQALAMGLPVAASDIPAHREFPIFTSNSTLAVCNWLAREINACSASKPGRHPVVYSWEESARRFSDVVERLLAESEAAAPRRAGSSRPGCRPCAVGSNSTMSVPLTEGSSYPARP